MNEYFIDGNNLIGAVDKLKFLQKKDKQLAREKLTLIIENFFLNKKINVHIFFDGFENEKINSTRTKIHYSGSKTADVLIKNSIANSKNRKNICVVSSDREIMNYAKVCSCNVISAFEFYEKISVSQVNDEETKIQKLESSVDEFKKLFGAN